MHRNIVSSLYLQISLSSVSKDKILRLIVKVKEYYKGTYNIKLMYTH